MVIYLAGLQAIPTEFYEAARIDGAGNGSGSSAGSPSRSCTPVIFFNLVMGIIHAFQVFTQAFVMTNGGPANATLFTALPLQRDAFKDSRDGVRIGLAWVLFVVILGLTLLLFRTSREWVFYTV